MNIIRRKTDGMLDAVYLDSGCSGLTVVNAGHHKTAPCHTFGPAVRDQYLIHFIKRGAGTYFAGGQEYRLLGGEAFLILPGEVTVYRADEREPWEYCWISYEGTDAPLLTKRAFGERLTAAYDASLYGRLYALVNDAAEEPDRQHMRILGLLYGLLESVCDGAVSFKRDIVRDAVSYIETNYFQNFDITELSKELGMSRAHFSTVFREETGKSPYRYLTEFRLKKAARLFETNPSLTVTEAAYSVGFSGIERFSEMFKKEFGVSPASYRKPR